MGSPIAAALHLPAVSPAAPVGLPHPSCPVRAQPTPMQGVDKAGAAYFGCAIRDKEQLLQELQGLQQQQLRQQPQQQGGGGPAGVMEWVSGRTAGPELRLADSALLTTASGLAQFHASDRFHPRTGEALGPNAGGGVCGAGLGRVVWGWGGWCRAKVVCLGRGWVGCGRGVRVVPAHVCACMSRGNVHGHVTCALVSPKPKRQSWMPTAQAFGACKVLRLRLKVPWVKSLRAA